MAINRLGFLDLVAIDDGKGLRGGILLTKPDTVPLEFHLTDCVRPTAAQRLLYGAVFDRHLNVEVFAKPLLNALAEKPDVVVTVQPGFYQCLADTLDMPVILVSSSKEVQSISKDHNSSLAELKKISQQEDLLEPFGRIKNIVLQVHSKEATQPAGKDPAQSSPSS